MRSSSRPPTRSTPRSPPPSTRTSAAPTAGGRRLLGPDAGAVAAARVRPARRDRADPAQPVAARRRTDAELAAEWLRGWVAAAVRAATATWPARAHGLPAPPARRAAPRASCSVVVGHLDVLALPGGDGAGEATTVAWLRLLGGAGILAAARGGWAPAPFVDGLRVDRRRRRAGRARASAWSPPWPAPGAGAWWPAGSACGCPLAAAVADYYRALFLNAVLPAGVLGDVDRAVRHGRQTATSAAACGPWCWSASPGRRPSSSLGLAVLLGAGPTPAHGRGRRRCGPAAWALAELLAALVAVAALGLGWSAGRRRRGCARVADGAAHRRSPTPAAACSPAAPGPALAAALRGRAGRLPRAVRGRRPRRRLAPPRCASCSRCSCSALLAMALPLNIGGWGPREGVTAVAFGTAGLGAAQGLPPRSSTACSA